MNDGSNFIKFDKAVNADNYDLFIGCRYMQDSETVGVGQ